MLVLGRKYKFTDIEKNRLKNKKHNINVIK